MNREIKFRVWDKKSKKMRELDMISFHNSRGCFDHDDSNLPTQHLLQSGVVKI